MRSFGQIILAMLAASLSCTRSTVYPQTAKQQADDENRKDVCVKALQCTQSLIDFHLYSQFKVYTNTTLNQLEKHWAKFHESKSVFLEFRHLKVVSKASKLAIKLLRDECEVAASQPFRDEKELLRGLLQTIQGKRKHEDIELRREEQDARQEAIEQNAHFNFMKMHLPHHYRGHVERLGALGAYSMESGESAHQQQIKDGYCHSNHHNYSQQIIEYYMRMSVILIF